MKFIFNSFFILFLIVFNLKGLTETKSVSNGEVEIVFLGGQSNMAGKGVYEELSTIDKQRIEKISNRVMLSTDGRDAFPLSYFNGSNHQKSFGPELFLGLILAEENPDKNYLFIKMAQGGTSLYGAWSPNWTKQKAEASENGKKKQNMKLYSDHIAAIYKNVEILKTEEKAYRITGMLWMQGEKDSRLELSATTYGENLKTFIQSYRTEFNAPKMPFVFGQINCPPRKYKAGTEIVRNQMLEVNQTVEYTDIVETSMDSTWNDFPKHADNLHYNTEGQKRLGMEFAIRLGKLQE